MSNNLTQSPLLIDTPFNPGAASPSKIPGYSLYVTKIVYTPASLGNGFQILNNAGAVKAQGTAGPNDAGESSQQNFEEGQLVLNPVEGWYVPMLGTGDTLAIYFSTYRV